MSSLATVSQRSAIPEFTTVTRSSSVRHGLWRKWFVALLIAVLLSPGWLAFPPVWHGTVRAWLSWQASRNGCELTVNRISGGIFGAIRLEGVHLRQRRTAPEKSARGTDLTVKNARFVVAWRLPWVRRSASWMKEVRLEGVSGCFDLTAESRSGETLPGRVNEARARWLPEVFSFQADDFQIRREDYRVELSRFLLTGKTDAPGEIAAREMRITGPGFTGVVNGWHGQTFCKSNRLTLTGTDAGRGITVTSATLDVSRIDRRYLEWDCHIIAFGGAVRGQGSADFAHERVAVEIAATLHHVSLASLARTLEMGAPVDGQIEDASVTYRGDPANLSSSQVSLSARATGFQWENRRCETLDAQAVMINQRIQVNRFDVRQHGNQIARSGEFPLPTGDVSRLVWMGAERWWQAAGFSCDLDSHLKDLHAMDWRPSRRGFAY